MSCGIEFLAAGTYEPPGTDDDHDCKKHKPCGGSAKNATTEREDVGVVAIRLQRPVAEHSFAGVVTVTGIAGGYTYAIEHTDDCTRTVRTFLNGVPADVGFNFVFTVSC